VFIQGPGWLQAHSCSIGKGNWPAAHRAAGHL